MNEKNISIVIFGASGDLTKRKLIPGLYNLYQKGRLPENFQIVGISRTEFTDEAFRERVKQGTQEFSADTFKETQWNEFSDRIFYLAGSATEPDLYEKLEKFLQTHEQGIDNRLYYLSTAPRFFLPIVEQLHNAGMVEDGEYWKRVIIEKPFGTDSASAENLNTSLHKLLREEQIYRIDHYLAKETVQNLMVLRFGNTIYEPLWNRNYIDHIQITALETVDVGHRAAYYDNSGIVRDMVQNHLLQLMALVAMEPPASLSAEKIRNEKAKVLQSLRPIQQSELSRYTVRGQYDGYLATDGVKDNSETATYTAIEAYVDNWRWKGVPFYLRTGKALKRKTTEIIVRFKTPPHMLYPIADEQEHANFLAINIQPHEGIHFRFDTKVPDTVAQLQPVDMEFDYHDTFDHLHIPEAYERLLMEAMQGDTTLFTRADEIVAAWDFVDRILEGWQTENAPEMSNYELGSWGPQSADDLLAHHNRTWRRTNNQRRTE